MQERELGGRQLGLGWGAADQARLRSASFEPWSLAGPKSLQMGSRPREGGPSAAAIAEGHPRVGQPAVPCAGVNAREERAFLGRFRIGSGLPHEGRGLAPLPPSVPEPHAARMVTDARGFPQSGLLNRAPR